MCDQQSLRPACAYAQSDQSLCKSLEYFMIVKLLTEHRLEFQSLKVGCTGSYESTLVKMPNCWKSHTAAQLFTTLLFITAIITIYFSITMLSRIYAFLILTLKLACLTRRKICSDINKKEPLYDKTSHMKRASIKNKITLVFIGQQHRMDRVCSFHVIYS